MNTTELIRIENLKQHFPIYSGLFLKQTGTVHAVDGVSLSIDSGQTLGLVGESGCGKSTLGRSVIRLYEPTAGSVLFQGTDIGHLGRKHLHGFRRDVQMIFQDPYSSLNPRKTVGSIIEQPLLIHNYGNSEKRRQRVIELLDRIGLGAWAMDRYPHEFSGGQRQRIAIARAIALKPKLIIADEPVSALDVSVQSQILNLLKDLQEEMGMAYLFISHELAVVKHVSHRVAVVYLGVVVEYGDRKLLFEQPKHPYTRALLEAHPEPGAGRKKDRLLISGELPSPINPPSGCRFHTRCPFAQDRCKSEVPVLENIEPTSPKGYYVACHFWRQLQHH